MRMHPRAAASDNPVLVDKYMPGIELEVDVISDGKDVLDPGHHGAH